MSVRPTARVAARDEMSNAPSRPPAARWRRVLVTALVVIGCVLAPISVVGVWVKTTLLDTDQYVATVGPLASDPDIQQALANRITTIVVENTDLDTQIADALPPRASFVAPAVAASVHDFVHQAALKVVQSDRFEMLWVEANRRAHPQIVALLEGNNGDRISTKNGQVTLELGPIANQVQAALQKAGIDVFSGSDTTSKNEIVLIKSAELESAQRYTNLLQKAAWVLPIIPLLAFAVAILLSRNRRRTTLRAALGVAFGMAFFLAVFNGGRHFYLDALPAMVSRPAAGAVYDQLLSILRLSLRTVFLVAILVAAGAWIAGPGRTATKTREGALHLARGRHNSADPTPVGVFVAHYKAALRICAIGVPFVVLAFLDAPTPRAVVTLAITAVALVLLIEFLGRSASDTDTVGEPDMDEVR